MTELGGVRLRHRLLLGAAAAVAATGLIAWLTRGAARDDGVIPYSPNDLPKPIAESVWVVDGDPISAMGLKLPVRMTVVRLKDGGLMLHSPTQYTAGVGRAHKALGPIRHLVAPTVIGVQ